MTDNMFIDAFKRMLTMALALIMALGSVIPIATQEVSAFSGKVGSKYTVHWYKELHYGPGEGGSVHGPGGGEPPRAPERR